MTINVTKLREVLEFVTGHRAQHDQGCWTYVEEVPDRFFTRVQNVLVDGVRDDVDVLAPDENWSCGTEACLAGWAALLNGWRPVRNEDAVVYRDGEARFVQNVAVDVLGLTRAEADALFAGSNDLYDLWSLASEFTDGEIQVPANLPQDENEENW